MWRLSCPRGQVSFCSGEEIAVSGVELKSGWSKVRAGRTVAVRRRNEQPWFQLLRMLIVRMWVVTDFWIR